MGLATMKYVYICGVCALLGSVILQATADSSESSNSDESFEDRGNCKCDKKFCKGNVGPKVVGCPNTNSFRQCNDANCAVIACPADQVWNYLKNACSECDAGKHVAAALDICVCNQGTTLNSSTKSCVACPSGSTQEAERCFCPSTTVLDYPNNACKTCPQGALIRDRKCVCNSTQFFNQKAWTCNSCPGTWTTPSKGKSQCRCTGPNQIFYQKDVTCYTCPTGTTADSDNDECDCARNTGLVFDYTTGTCACKPGYSQNTSGVCTKSTTAP